MTTRAARAMDECRSELVRTGFIDRATSAIRSGKTLPQMLLESCREHPDRIALHSLGRDLTCRDLDRDSAALASYLVHRLKLSVGDRVALMMPNLLQFPVAALAVQRAGLVLVPVNPLYTARELAHQLKDSGAASLIVLDRFAAVAEQALSGTAVQSLILTSSGDLLSWPKSAIVNLVVRYVHKQVPPHGLRGAHRWTTALAEGRRLPEVAVRVAPTDVVQLQYTGGTTGLSKGATLTHQALMANVAGSEQWLGDCLLPGKDCGLIALPLYHIAAFSNLLYSLTHGIRGVLIPNARDIPSLVAAFAEHRPAVFGGVNTLFDALMLDSRFRTLDFSGLKLSIQGGTALRRRTGDDWLAMTGCRITEMYGLSETCGGCTANRWDVDNPIGSIGLTMAGVEASLRDESGMVVPEGEAGELCLRGAPLLIGYHGHPEESARAFFDDGWFRTGDIARRDPQGYLYVLDRRKDMILVSGFNVYPNEIEDTVAMHPGVLEAAAVAIADERTGEAVKLVVVRRDPALDEATLRAHCREHLTGYKQPRVIEFRDALPKTAVGKVLRRELRSS